MDWRPFEGGVYCEDGIVSDAVSEVVLKMGRVLARIATFGWRDYGARFGK